MPNNGIITVRPDKRIWWDCRFQSLLMTASEPFKSQDCPTWQLSAGAVFKGDWMHYYQFHIGDYASHTAHLDEIEDLAYRRMLDYCYLNEIGLPESIEEVARLIRMRTHCERIANVLREFFTLHDDGVWRQARIQAELSTIHAKSAKARESARKRWESTDANALRTHCERNAIQEPRTKNQEPIKEIRATTRPTVAEIADYVSTRDTKIDPQHFFDYYTANGWKVGKNSMKDWRATVRTWERRENENTKRPINGNPDPRRLSGAERTRLAREAAYQRQRAAAAASDLGCVESD